MDLEPEDFQFMSLPSIFLTSITLILNRSHFTLFSQITLSLILPISLLFLLHVQISHSLLAQIRHHQTALVHSPPYSASESHLMNLLTSDWSCFLLFKAIYLLSLLIFSLLATSAIVYTVASIFSSKILTLKKVLTIVPKVWKRLIKTFLYAFLVLFTFHLVSAMAFASFLLFFKKVTIFAALIALTLSLLYVGGLVWISVIWHFASVVSVLEDIKGVEALNKSQKLIKGKSLLACSIFMVLNSIILLIEFGYRKIVLEGKEFELKVRIGVGLAMLVMLMVVSLVGLVVQTLVYFVCKSYHHEVIDRPSLADHLEVYLGEYMPLKAKDVQMESFTL